MKQRDSVAIGSPAFAPARLQYTENSVHCPTGPGRGTMADRTRTQARAIPPERTRSR